MGSGIYIQTNTCKDVRQLYKIVGLSTCTCTLAYNENIPLLNELNGKVKTEEVYNCYTFMLEWSFISDYKLE